MRAGDRVLLLAPHPDDETLAAGGLLQQAVAAGAAVRVVYATDGDNNPWAQRAEERRWQLDAADRVRWACVRRREALAALTTLGVARADVRFLGWPDQGLTSLVVNDGDRAVVTLLRAVAGDPPTIVLAPTPLDLHPDHSALALLVRLALRRLVPAMCRPLVLEYLVHRRRGSLGAVAPTWHVRLSAEQIDRKRAAIRAHASQLRLRPRALLAYAAGREQFFAPRRPGVDAGAAAHPIRAATIDGDTLRLRVRQRPHLGAFGATTLYLAIERREGTARWRAVLPCALASIGLVRLVCGVRVACGLSESGAEGRELRLPLAMFRDARAVFAKLERRFGFFDEAGWCELAVRGYPRTHVFTARRDGARPLAPARQPPDRRRRYGRVKFV